MEDGTLETISEEIEEQPRILEGFSRTKQEKVAVGSILVGAGDSYAAAMAGFYASNGRILALDPYSLATEPGICKGLEVFFISASGRTASNVLAAKLVKGIAKKTTAITAVEGSPLAKQVDTVFKMPMSYRPRTPGILSFTLTLLTVMKLAGKHEGCDFRRALESAKRGASQVLFGEGTTYFLGNSVAYPASLYSAAKTYEFLGAKAHSELLEEFSHLQLFSLGRADVVNVLSAFDPLGLSRRLTKSLKEGGFRSHLVPSKGSSDLEALFHSVFVVQLAVLREAKRMGLTEPAFLRSENKLRASDSMIY